MFVSDWLSPHATAVWSWIPGGQNWSETKEETTAIWCIDLIKWDQRAPQTSGDRVCAGLSDDIRIPVTGQLQCWAAGERDTERERERGGDKRKLEKWSKWQQEWREKEVRWRKVTIGNRRWRNWIEGKDRKDRSRWDSERFTWWLHQPGRAASWTEERITSHYLIPPTLHYHC